MQRAAPHEPQPTHTVTRRSKAHGHRTTDRQLTDGFCKPTKGTQHNYYRPWE